MIINPNVFLLLLLALVITIVICVLLYRLHIQDEEHLDKVDDYVKRKYIPATVVLHNAVLEAYEEACKKENKFEIEAYGKLLREIQGKW